MSNDCSKKALLLLRGGIDRFLPHLAGQWILPQGEFSNAVLTDKFAIQRLCKYEGYILNSRLKLKNIQL